MSSEFINSGKISADGGHGGHGQGGGQGGAGGLVALMQVGKEFTLEGITINDLKHPHKEYWKLILKKLVFLLKKPVAIVVEVIIGLLIVYIAFKMRWN